MRIIFVRSMLSLVLPFHIEFNNFTFLLKIITSFFSLVFQKMDYELISVLRVLGTFNSGGATPRQLTGELTPFHHNIRFFFFKFYSIWSNDPHGGRCMVLFRSSWRGAAEPVEEKNGIFKIKTQLHTQNFVNKIR